MFSVSPQTINTGGDYDEISSIHQVYMYQNFVLLGHKSVKLLCINKEVKEIESKKQVL